MASEQVKVLTVGPPCGRITELIAKVTAINTKYGPFAALLVLGDLFKPYVDGADLGKDEDQLLRGTLQSPVPIYFALPPSPLHPRVRAAIVETGTLDDDESKSDGQQASKVAQGLYFLGKEGVRLVPSGSSGPALRVAVVGGLWEPQHWQDSLGQPESALEGIMNPYMTSSSFTRLMSHSSFKEPAVTKLPPSNEDEEPPATLAAARAQMLKRTEALQKQADQVAKPPIDILLTTAWPSGVTMFANPEKLPHATSRVWGAPIIAQLTRNAQPRYHFALAPGSCGEAETDGGATPLGIVGLDGTEEGKQLRRTGAFWEREPFRAEGTTHPQCNVTRFVSLARFANDKKQRWFMALNLAPAQKQGAGRATASVALPAGTTASPFTGGGGFGAQTKRKEAESDDMGSGPNFRWTDNRPKKQRTAASGLPSKPNAPMPPALAKKVIPVGPQDCWFCLSNPQCAKHLIVAIGTECYVAMPKGQLPPTSHPLSPVPGGGHVLIVPIEHFPSLLGHPDAELARPIANEMQQWRSALRKAYASFDAILVSWEICRTTGSRAGHMQSQVVPIPRALYEGQQGGKGSLVDFFRHAAAKYEYEMVEDEAEVAQLTVIDSKHSDYFRLDLDDKTWFMSLEAGRRFYLQFPRETLAHFLDVPDRADWKRCARTDAIEAAETKAFKAAFDEYAQQVTEEE